MNGESKFSKQCLKVQFDSIFCIFKLLFVGYVSSDML